VADVLNKLPHNAQNARFFKGLENFKILGNILNLYYADDTLLFLKH
jgi:hypothetical protein